MGYSVAQTVSFSITSGTSGSGTLTATSAGSLLTCIVGVQSTTVTPTVTDNAGNTYTLRQSVTNSPISQYVFECYPGTAGATLATCSISGAVSTAILFREYTGVTGGFDVGTASSGIGPSTSVGPTSTTAFAQELVIITGAIDEPAFGGPSSGYSNYNNSGTPTVTVGIADKQTSSIGTQSGGFSVVPTSRSWTNTILTYNTTAGSGVTVNVGLLAGSGSIFDAQFETPGTVNAELLTGSGGSFPAVFQGGTQIAAHLLTGSGTSFQAAAPVGLRVNMPILTGSGDVLKFLSAQGSLVASVPILTGSGVLYQASAQQSPSISVPLLSGLGGSFPASFQTGGDYSFAAPLLSGSGLAYAPTLSIGPTIQLKLLSGSGTILGESVSVGITFPVGLIQGSGSILRAQPQTAATIAAHLLAGSGAILDASAQAGQAVSVKILAGSGAILSARAQVAVNLAAKILQGSGRVLSASAQSSVRLSLNLLSGSGVILDAQGQAGRTLNQRILAGSGSIFPVSFQTPVVIAVELISGDGEILFPSIYAGGGARIAVSLLQGFGDVLDANFSSVTVWFLTIRQQIQYTGLAQVWRQIPNAMGDAVWFQVISNMPCYLYTTDNMDNPAEGVFQVKDSTIFTDNRLHYPVQAPIYSQDKVYYQGPNALNPPSPDTGSWFTVMGQGRNRPSAGLRNANQSQVYLNPDKSPPMLGVA